MRVLVSSAKGANGPGYGAILAFDSSGNALGTFCDDSRVADPRGLCVDPTPHDLSSLVRPPGLAQP